MSLLNEYKTLVSFKIDKDNGNIDDNSIYFISDAKLIYTRDTYYGENTINNVIKLKFISYDGEQDWQSIHQEVETALGGHDIEELCNLILNGSINTFIDETGTRKLKIYECVNNDTYCILIYGYEIIGTDNEYWFFNQANNLENIYPTALAICDGQATCIIYNKTTNKFIIKYASP